MSNDSTPIQFVKPSDNNVDLVKLTDADNVAVALRNIAASEALQHLTTTEEIPKGHKVALQKIPAGNAVIKYDQIIGYANADISIGQHVHTHNIEFRPTDHQYEFGVGNISQPRLIKTC